MDEERHAAGLLDQQHVPGEPVALARPAVVARVGEVPQRQGELDDHPRHRQARRARARAAHRARPRGTAVRPTEREPSRRRGQSGSKNTVDAADHQPREHPDREQRPGADVERHQHQPRGRPGPPPQQQRHDEAVERGAGDREGVRDRRRCPAAARAPARRRGRAARARGAGPAPASRPGAWRARRRRRRPPPGSGAATPSRRRRCRSAGPAGVEADARPSGATTASAATSVRNQ